MPDRTYFNDQTFEFLRELKVNNDRAWFEENKERYEGVVKEPFLDFIADAGKHLRRLTPHIVADPRPVGGSFFRIYRDVRFSKDKSPYKTHAAAHFRHAATSADVHGPGFYLHLEPGASMLAGGIWRPEPQSLKKIRGRIMKDPNGWRAVIKKVPPLEGETLLRPPQGYPPDHPMIEELKRKDFIAWLPLKDDEVCSPGFMTQFAGGCRKISPLPQFISKAIDLAW